MNKHEAGFTITELTITVTVTTLIVLIISAFMLRSTQTATLEMAKASILHEIQLTLDSVANDVRSSANADLNNRNPDPNAPGGNQFGWTSTASTVVLATAATDSAKNIIFSDPSNYVTVKNNYIYYVSNNTLYKRIVAADVDDNRAITTCPPAIASSSCPADKKLLSDVSQFEIRYVDGNNAQVTPTNARSIEITLTAASTKYTQTQSATYTTRMVFRND